jgi:hypothetical protein
MDESGFGLEFAPVPEDGGTLYHLQWVEHWMV